MSFLVTTEKFQGPLHVLLGLIEKRKLHISEITLAAVTDDFVHYMSTTTLSYSEITSFLSIASTLLIIKVKSLLPKEELSPEESVSIDDLTRRLEQYAIIQKFGTQIGGAWGKIMWYERPFKTVRKEPMFIPDETITLTGLKTILSEVLQTVPVPQVRDTATVRATIKIEDIIKKFEDRVSRGSVQWSTDIMTAYTSAKTPLEQKRAKVEIVVSFLAMLEMFKKGLINVTQTDKFNQIDIYSM